MHGRWTYPSFFAADRATIEAGQRTIHAPPEGPRVWTPGTGDNWQAQHPPLYYALLAPAYLASKDWSLGAQLFLLRALSYAFACAGLCIVIFAMLRHRDDPAKTWTRAGAWTLAGDFSDVVP